MFARETESVEFKSYVLDRVRELFKSPIIRGNGRPVLSGNQWRFSIDPFMISFEVHLNIIISEYNLLSTQIDFTLY